MRQADNLRWGSIMADRFEREIDEILRKIDDFIPEGRRRQQRKVSRPMSGAHAWLGRTLSSISLGHVMLWSLLAFLAAFFLRAIPGAGWLMIGALVVFVTALVLQVMTPGSTRSAPEKRWRGQPIDYSTGPSLPDRIKAWVKKNRKKAR
jgi:hypothetical protein